MASTTKNPAAWRADRARKCDRVGSTIASEKASNLRENQAKIADARLKYLTRRLHALGERPLYEMLREVIGGADLAQRLEVYARIDPAVLAALGGVALPPVARLVGEALQ